MFQAVNKLFVFETTRFILYLRNIYWYLRWCSDGVVTLKKYSVKSGHSLTAYSITPHTVDKAINYCFLAQIIISIMICKQIINIIFKYWFQVPLFNTSTTSNQYYSFVCTQLNGFNIANTNNSVLYQIIFWLRFKWLWWTIQNLYVYK